MDNETTKNSKVNMPPSPAKKVREHVALSETSMLKINKWFEQIFSKKKIKLSRKDLINWLIEKLPENLSTNDLNSIIEKFYDEEAFLLQLLRDVKKAKRDGEAIPAIATTVKVKKSNRQKELPSGESSLE